MSVQGEAKLGKPAPKFTVKAVVDEEFVDISSRSITNFFIFFDIILLSRNK